MNSRLDTIQAAILNVKLPYLIDWVRKRKLIAERYTKLLNNLDVNSIKLIRDGENLLINNEVSDAEALVDEGGYGFEPSLYIVGNNQDRVCKIVEDLAKSMENMS